MSGNDGDILEDLVRRSVRIRVMSRQPIEDDCLFEAYGCLALFHVVPVALVHDAHAREAGADDEGCDEGDVVPCFGFDFVEEESLRKGYGEGRGAGEARGHIGGEEPPGAHELFAYQHKRSAERDTHSFGEEMRGMSQAVPVVGEKDRQAVVVIRHVAQHLSGLFR